jgi:hypothetical protein
MRRRRAVVAEKVTRPRASGPFQFTGSESFSGVRVGGQIPDSDPNLGRVHPRANRETQIGQISQIAQRATRAGMVAVRQGPLKGGRPLGTHGLPEAVPIKRAGCRLPSRRGVFCGLLRLLRVLRHAVGGRDDAMRAVTAQRVSSGPTEGRRMTRPPGCGSDPAPRPSGGSRHPNMRATRPREGSAPCVSHPT